MPAAYQGIRIQGGVEPIPNLNTPEGVSDTRQRGKLDYIRDLNRSFAGEHPEQTELEARIAGYELAFRMQAEAPDAVDLTLESEATRRLYGMEQKETATFGRLCLLSRRLVERGVRFVQLYHGAGSKWDAHTGIEKNHRELCRAMDLPVAGLLRDLKQRGLLDETLVVWGGEFGRTPMQENREGKVQAFKGRDHHTEAFTIWMTGAGIKRGISHGETDEIGYAAISGKVTPYDIQATILQQLGFDHEKLTYPFQGRPFRLTDVHGKAIEELVGV